MKAELGHFNCNQENRNSNRIKKLIMQNTTFKINDTKSTLNQKAQVSDDEIWIKDVKVWNDDLLELNKYIELVTLAVMDHSSMYNHHLYRIGCKKECNEPQSTIEHGCGYQAAIAESDVSQVELEHLKIDKIHNELKNDHDNIQVLINALEQAFKK
ncbi:MAG: hypothetical protein ACI9GZ_002707 [Bacteroidia bacterium]|jgi:hypothetical protein